MVLPSPTYVATTPRSLRSGCPKPQPPHPRVATHRPTVAISQAPLIEVLNNLREAGFQPVAEDATGASIDVRPSPSRISSYQGRPATTRETIDAGLIQL